MIKIGSKVMIIQADPGEEEYLLAIGTVDYIYLNAINVAFDTLKTRSFLLTQIQELKTDKQ